VESGVVRFEPVMLTPELDAEKHAVLEVLRDGQLRRTPVQFETVPACGAAVESGGKWQVLHPAAVLDKADFAGRRLFVKPPDSFNGRTVSLEDWALLEGVNFCGRPRGVGRDFHALLHGFGQSLELGLGPYNQAADGRITVAGAITNFGAIKSATCRGDTWVIEFRHRIEPGASVVWVWTESGVIGLSSSAVEWCGDSCRVACTVFTTAPAVFGIAFDGICVGTAITEAPPYAHLCSQIESSRDWENTAAWLRWFRLPLLYKTIRRSVANRIEGNECRTLCIWTTSTISTAPDLRQEDASTDQWQYLLRHFFERWRLCPSDAVSLMKQFELLTGDPQVDLERCWERHDELLNIHPALLARAANLGVAAVYPTASTDERRVFLDMLINVTLDLSRNATDADRKRSEQKCLNEAAKSMNVDIAFVERSLLADARLLYEGARVYTRNLRIALGVRPFRQWLTARLV